MTKKRETYKEKRKNESNEIKLSTDVAKIFDAKKRKASIKSIELYCAACTKTVVISKKEDGKLIPQQSNNCPHIIFKKVVMK